MNLLSTSHTYILKLIRENRVDFATLTLVYQRDFDVNRMGLEGLLSKSEMDAFGQITSSIRKRSFLLGRYAAKQAIQGYYSHLAFNQMDIRSGVFNQPYLEVSTECHISISHNPDFAAAIAYPSSYIMGLDIENRDRSVEAIDRYCTDTELTVLKNTPLPNQSDNVSRLILWTLKEALSKTLKCGMMVPFSMLEIDQAQIEDTQLTSTFKNFSQYKGITWLDPSYILSITLPRRTTLEILL